MLRNKNKLVDELNVLLANYQIHYQKVKSYSWKTKVLRLKGIDLNLDELSNNALHTIDDLANRIMSLGKAPLTAYSDCLQVASIKETKTPLVTEATMVKSLLDDFKKLISIEKKVINQSSKYVN